MHGRNKTSSFPLIRNPDPSPFFSHSIAPLLLPAALDEPFLLSRLNRTPALPCLCRNKPFLASKHPSLHSSSSVPAVCPPLKLLTSASRFLLPASRFPILSSPFDSTPPCAPLNRRWSSECDKGKTRLDARLRLRRSTNQVLSKHPAPTREPQPRQWYSEPSSMSALSIRGSLSGPSASRDVAWSSLKQPISLPRCIIREIPFE